MTRRFFNLKAFKTEWRMGDLSATKGAGCPSNVLLLTLHPVHLHYFEGTTIILDKYSERRVSHV